MLEYPYLYLEVHFPQITMDFIDNQTYDYSLLF